MKKYQTVAVNGQPNPVFLVAMRDANLDWSILSELVSNSFNAGANYCHIRMGTAGAKGTGQKPKSTLYVFDDGRGFDDLGAAICLGGHMGHAHPRAGDISKYGVGMKDALAWLWGRTNIISWNKTETWKMAIDYDDCVANDYWPGVGKTVKYPFTYPFTKDAALRTEIEGRFAQAYPPKWLEDKAYGLVPLTVPATGSVFHINTEYRKTAFASESIGKLLWRFFPWSNLGGRVTVARDGSAVNVVSTADIRFPNLTETVSVNIVVNGLSATVTAGIMDDDMAYRSLLGSNSVKLRRNGCHVVYGPQIICELPNAFGDKPCSNVFVYVELCTTGSGDWLPYLNRNKDELIEHVDDLAQCVFKAIEPVLDKASALSADAILSELVAPLEQILNGGIQSGTADATTNGIVATRQIKPPLPPKPPGPPRPPGTGVSRTNGKVKTGFKLNGAGKQRGRGPNQRITVRWDRTMTADDNMSREEVTETAIEVCFNPNDSTIKSFFRRCTRDGKDTLPFRTLLAMTLAQTLTTWTESPGELACALKFAGVDDARLAQVGGKIGLCRSLSKTFLSMTARSSDKAANLGEPEDIPNNAVVPHL